MTRTDHATGTDRPQQKSLPALTLPTMPIVVNVQGMSRRFRHLPLMLSPRCWMPIAAPAMATLCHPFHGIADVFIQRTSSNCVVAETGKCPLFQSGAGAVLRDAWAAGATMYRPGCRSIRHIGLYAYRASFLHARFQP